jgi:hypothetical protein
MAAGNEAVSTAVRGEPAVATGAARAGHKSNYGYRRGGSLTGGGTTGNERLTTAAGALLLVLLAVLGVTIVRIGQLLWVHLFVGMLLVAPLLLKLSSTGYRFVRYYAGNQRYRLEGPPEIGLRVLAPMVVLSTLVVFISGIWLLFAGPSSRETVFPIHKDSFFVWLAFMAVHVLGHLPGMSRVLRADYGASAGLSSDVTGRTGRTLALVGALVAGVVLAVVLIPEFGPWLAPGATHHHH